MTAMTRMRKDSTLRHAALQLAGGNVKIAAARLRHQAIFPPPSATVGYITRRFRVAETLDPRT